MCLHIKSQCDNPHLAIVLRAKQTFVKGQSELIMARVCYLKDYKIGFSPIAYCGGICHCAVQSHSSKLVGDEEKGYGTHHEQPISE